MAKAPIKRRTQQERRDTTMQKIMDASFQVMKQQGYPGLTMAEVAKTARVSRGAILHHYPNKDSLILATVEYLHASAQRTSLRRAEGIVTPSKALDELITDGMEYFFGDHFWTILEVTLSSKNSQFVRDQERITGKYRRDAEAMWQDILVQTGIDRGIAEKIVSLSLAIIRGFAVQRKIRDEPIRTAHLLEIWQEMVWAYWPDYLPQSASAGATSSSRRGAPADA